MAETRSRPMTTRREFVATAAAAFATRYTRWLPRGHHLPLGFSTLGCPAWTWPQILDFAAAHGYVAVELRGLQATMDQIGRASCRERVYSLRGGGALEETIQ